MASKFADVRGVVVASTGAGLSLSEAATQVGVALPTLKSWITKGHKGNEPFASFVAELGAARVLAESRPAPMSEAELFEVVSATARKGSVQAMKLYWEMLRGDEDTEEKPAAPFGEFDELAQRRAG